MNKKNAVKFMNSLSGFFNSKGKKRKLIQHHIVLPDCHPHPEPILIVKRPDAYILEQPTQKKIDLKKVDEYLLLRRQKTLSQSRIDAANLLENIGILAHQV